MGECSVSGFTECVSMGIHHQRHKHTAGEQVTIQPLRTLKKHVHQCASISHLTTSVCCQQNSSCYIIW